MSNNVPTKLTQGKSAEGKITWSAATSHRIKEEAAKGRVWILGASGTGKSFITSHLGGFDLDRIGFRFQDKDSGEWEVDLTRIPVDAKIVCGCFSVPTYRGFYDFWKPTNVYCLNVSTETYQRTWMRKAASKRNGLFWMQALGVDYKGKTLHHDPSRGENPAALREHLDWHAATLRADKIPFVTLMNDHDEDRGNAWDEGGKNEEAYPDDLIGLGLLAIEGSSYARTLLRLRAPNERYNPNGWRRLARIMQKGGLRLNPKIEAKLSASAAKWQSEAGKFKIPPSRNPRNPAYKKS